MHSGAFKDDIITEITFFFLLLAHSSGALARVSEPSPGPERNLSSAAAQALGPASEILLFLCLLVYQSVCVFEKEKGETKSTYKKR